MSGGVDDGLRMGRERLNGWSSVLRMKKRNFGPEAEEARPIETLVLCRTKYTDLAITGSRVPQWEDKR